MGSTPDTLTALIQDITSLIGLTIPIAVGLCLLLFLWAGFQFMAHADSPDKRKEYVKWMTFGGIALFIIVSLAGIVYLVADTFFDDVMY